MSYDVCIIGAGVIGCAVARELSARGRRVVVLDAFPSQGMGVSSRNSEVVHAGLYYPPESLKTRLCIEGREELYRYCDAKGVSHRRMGKLIVARTDDEEPALVRLAENAAGCGVTSLRMLTKSEVRTLEPEVRATAALFSPDTGIVSAHELCRALRIDAEATGAEFAFRTCVSRLMPEDGGWSIETRELAADGELLANFAPVRRDLAPPIRVSGERYLLRCPAVVIAAGLYSDFIAAIAGFDIGALGLEQHWVKGEYFSLASRWRNRVQHLIYPLPEKNIRGLGVHLTFDLAGELRLGPNVLESLRDEAYEVDAAHARPFYDAARQYLPDLREEDLFPAYAGIRPKLGTPGGPPQDFAIRALTPSFTTLAGIESPGLTACLAIGRYVAEL